MVIDLLRRHIAGKVNRADGSILHRNLFQLQGESRLGVAVLGLDGFVAGLLQCFLVRHAVLFRQRNVVGTIVFPGCCHHVVLRHPPDVVCLVQHVLPGMPFREGFHHQLRAFVNGL